jgi:hypothetical protein
MDAVVKLIQDIESAQLRLSEPALAGARKARFYVDYARKPGTRWARLGQLAVRDYETRADSSAGEVRPLRRPAPLEMEPDPAPHRLESAVSPRDLVKPRVETDREVPVQPHRDPRPRHQPEIEVPMPARQSARLQLG